MAFTVLQLKPHSRADGCPAACCWCACCRGRCERHVAAPGWLLPVCSMLSGGGKGVEGQLCDYHRTSLIGWHLRGQQFGGAVLCLAGHTAAHRQKPLLQSCLQLAVDGCDSSCSPLKGALHMAVVDDNTGLPALDNGAQALGTDVVGNSTGCLSTARLDMIAALQDKPTGWSALTTKPLTALLS